MDVIAQAIRVGVWIFVWMVKWSYELSIGVTYNSFGGLYKRSRAVTWVVVLVVWVVVWVVGLSLSGSSNALPGGVGLGLVWGVLMVFGVQKTWEEEIALLEEMEAEKGQVFQPPLMPVIKSQPVEVAPEFDEDELEKKE